jgi:hypothetical protein
MSSMSRRRPAILYGAPAFALSVLFLWVLVNRHHEEPFVYPPPTQVVPEQEVIREDWNFVRDARNFLMTDARCDEAFPGLFKEIDRAVEVRKDDHITIGEVDSIKKVKGYMRAMIYDQQVCKISKRAKELANQLSFTSSTQRKSISITASKPLSTRSTAQLSLPPNPSQTSNSHSSQMTSQPWEPNGHTRGRNPKTDSGSCPTSGTGPGRNPRSAPTSKCR